MNSVVRTRYAPSPTGNLHIGGARTALFAYLWAKKNNGQFILRIEDTDKTREKPESWHSLYYGLKWLGIDWEEGLAHPDTKESVGPYGPYIQSERTEIYAKYAQELIEKGNAYYCFCTSERLEQMRQDQQARKEPPRYDRTCRSLSADEVAQRLEAGEKHVIRLAVPLSGDLIVADLLRGDIIFHLADVDDQVLMKADSMPTYHLANVVDDHLMNISHVIRGQEWLPSTPKHVLLYQMFGWTAPIFVHLTVFLSKKGGKMSKRDGETSLFAFRDQGYLPQAIVNGIAFLGWNPKTTEEFFTMDELIQRFDLSMINTGNPVFEVEKLQWMNQHYMKKLSVDEAMFVLRELVDSASDDFSDAYADYLSWLSELPQAQQKRQWQLACERSKTFWEVVQIWKEMMHVPELDVAQLVWKKSTPQQTRDILEKLTDFMTTLPEESYGAQELEVSVRAWIAEQGFGNGDVLWPMRYALSHQAKSPPPFELAEIIGKQETLNRLHNAYQNIHI
ncbi:MAG: glutamate--tRNA ligase [Candidatus Kerfeldbacteria bacterium]|nr:glutamate--tRNA ligase [Candidatus Kerfeldbacteria bacterium]